jgi:alpha-galactosidase
MRLTIIASIATAAVVVTIAALLIANAPAPPAASRAAPSVPPTKCPTALPRKGPAPAALPREGSTRLALTPPMGWNGYNRFSINVTANLVKAEARALIASGMKKAGYRYILLDGGWALLRRDAAGNLQPDPAKFPDGIKALADYVHRLGLKFGIYTSAGLTNFKGTQAASYGHYRQDAATFASWGVDYLKFDYPNVPWSNYPGRTSVQVAHELAWNMKQALAATGRPIVFDVNDANAPRNHDQDWTWAPAFANQWRVSADIADSYQSMLKKIFGIGPPAHRSYDLQLYKYASPGHWNDPDVLEVGNGGMTTTEYQSQFSLWAEEAAPLIAGNDLRSMSAATRAILTNREVIAVDQDPLGRQGHCVYHNNGRWVLSKPLVGGARAVVLFNQTGTTATITATAAQLGLHPAAKYKWRDLWAHTTTTNTGEIARKVAPHAVAMYRVAATGAH